MFQQSLVPAYAQAYAQAQQPIYGTNQIAANMNQQNAAFNNADTSATQALARRGALNSGADTSTTDALATARAGNIASFNSQIPLLNTENTQQQTNNLLGLSSQFLNTVPKDTSTSSSSAGGASSTGTADTTGQQQSTTTQNPSLLSSIGGVAGLLSGIPGLSNLLSGMFGSGVGSGEAPQGNNTPGFGMGPYNGGDFGGET